MTLATLDVARLPFDQQYACKDGTVINMREFLLGLRTGIDLLAQRGYVKPNPSFGFAMAAPQREATYNLNNVWDDPYEFIWFVGGWGPDVNRYIANAIRKMRAMLREEDSTLGLRFDKPEAFRDQVDSADADGHFPWGDFPWGGANFLPLGPVVLFGAVSALTEVEDDAVTSLILGLLAQKIVVGDGLLAD